LRQVASRFAAVAGSNARTEAASKPICLFATHRRIWRTLLGQSLVDEALGWPRGRTRRPAQGKTWNPEVNTRVHRPAFIPHTFSNTQNVNMLPDRCAKWNTQLITVKNTRARASFQVRFGPIVFHGGHGGPEMMNRFEFKSLNGIKSCFGNLCESNWISKCICMCVHVHVCVLKANIWRKGGGMREDSLAVY
jgi:hypothetical protein